MIINIYIIINRSVTPTPPREVCVCARGVGTDLQNGPAMESIKFQRKIRTYGRFESTEIVLGTSTVRVYVMALGTDTSLDTLAFSADYF